MQAQKLRLQTILHENAISASSPNLVAQLRDSGFDDAFIRTAVTSMRKMATVIPSKSSATSKTDSVSDRIIEMALSAFRVGRNETGESFAVEKHGPSIALMFRGSRESFRNKLASMYRRSCGRVPTASALADALTVLQGEALDAEQEHTYLRLAPFGEGTIIDLGDAAGRCVLVQPGKWQILDRSPVLFRRTATTGTFQLPERGGSLAEFRKLLNVDQESWPVLLGWQISALMPEIEHAILLLGGQQGTAKTTTAKILINNFDPSPAEVRSQPRESEQWAIAAAGSWGIAIDNVSHIPDWWSDALCRSVTGDAWLRRKLYTDGELVVMAFRRVVVLTSIDAGALKGDLGDRVLLVDLVPIPEEARRYKSEIENAYRAAQPRIFGALLDLLVDVMTEVPLVQLERKPRMADFARVLAATDRVLNRRGDWGDGSDDQPVANVSAISSLEIFMSQKYRIAETVIESDPVAIAVQSLFKEVGTWVGTVGVLWTLLTPDRAIKDWPKSSRGFAGRLVRLTPALSLVGVNVEISKRTNKGRIVKISATADKAAETTVSTFTPLTNSTHSDVIRQPARDDQNLNGTIPVPTVTHTVTAGPLANGSENGSREGSDELLQRLSDSFDT